jgi:ParB family chromosome partitioning protein
MIQKKNKGLGRGLASLLGPNSLEDAGLSSIGSKTQYPQELPLSALRVGTYQPRKTIDEGALYELSESIKQQGIIQPLLVRVLKNQNTPENSYEIIAGERRFRAAQLAELKKVPVRVCDVDNQGAAAIALIENIQREDLNPLEEARGLQRLIHEFGLTQESAGRAVGRSRSATTNLLRLLKLPETVQTMLSAGDIDMGHARALLGLPHHSQLSVAEQIVAKNLSVRQTEQWIKKHKQGTQAFIKQKPLPKNKVVPLEKALSEILHTKVEIRMLSPSKGRCDGKPSGKIHIAFSDPDSLDNILEYLGSHVKYKDIP